MISNNNINEINFVNGNLEYKVKYIPKNCSSDLTEKNILTNITNSKINIDDITSDITIIECKHKIYQKRAWILIVKDTREMGSGNCNKDVCIRVNIAPDVLYNKLVQYTNNTLGRAYKFIFSEPQIELISDEHSQSSGLESRNNIELKLQFTFDDGDHLMTDTIIYYLEPIEIPEMQLHKDDYNKLTTEIKTLKKENCDLKQENKCIKEKISLIEDNYVPIDKFNNLECTVNITMRDLQQENKIIKEKILLMEDNYVSNNKFDNLIMNQNIIMKEFNVLKKENSDLKNQISHMSNNQVSNSCAPINVDLNQNAKFDIFIKDFSIWKADYTKWQLEHLNYKDYIDAMVMKYILNNTLLDKISEALNKRSASYIVVTDENDIIPFSTNTNTNANTNTNTDANISVIEGDIGKIYNKLNTIETDIRGVKNAPTYATTIDDFNKIKSTYVELMGDIDTLVGKMTGYKNDLSSCKTDLSDIKKEMTILTKEMTILTNWLASWSQKIVSNN
jgi:hypothetical protein